MQDSHMQAVGVWAWAGWFFFALAMLLFYRLWASDPHVALRAMRQEMAKARATIAELQAIEGTLKQRLELLDIELAEEQKSNRELSARIDVLEATKNAQAQTIDRMERYQRELMEKYEHMFARVVQLEARQDK
jgi:predicted nuclease with TOPRIM domain